VKDTIAAPQGIFASNVLKIETPEGVCFSLPLAGPVSRFLAWFIDMLAVTALSGAAGKLLYIVGVFSTDMMWALTVMSYFAINIGYGILFEWVWQGETPGKRVVGLRVLDAGGLKLQLSQIVLRNLMRFLDALPGLYVVGGASMVLTPRLQRLGDLAADTVVIRRKRVFVPDAVRLHSGERFNSLLEVPHLAARLRQQVSPELAEVAYEAIMRRDELSAEARVDIFRQLADRFRAIVKFPDDLAGSLTDERYVRNALEIVTSSRMGRRTGQGIN
jgi:uncharacterized RDD family membrane protein YckC